MNEIVVIVVCYNLILVTDFVDPINKAIKKHNGYMIIGLITLVIIIYVALIIYDMLKAFILKCYELYKRRKQRINDNKKAIHISKQILIDHENVKIAQHKINKIIKKINNGVTYDQRTTELENIK